MRNLVLATLLLSLAGCYKATVVKLGGGSPGNERRVQVHTVAWGLISFNEIDGSAVCGDKGVFSVSARQNIIDQIIRGLTGGI